MVGQSTRRLIRRMIGNKRIFFGCSLLTLIAFAFFVLQHNDGLAKFYTEQILGKNRPFDFSDRRQLVSVHPSCINKSCSWEEEQASRKKLISDTCRAVQQRAKDSYPRLVYKLSKAHKEHWLKFLLVIDSLKLIYCYVPKVGTTSWKRLLLVLEGKVNSTEKLGQQETHNVTHSAIRNLNSYSLEETGHILSTYRKFLFVRNPFERILSAYQDKFQNDYPASKTFRRIWSERIIRYGGGSQVQMLLAHQQRDDDTLNVTFSQFARFVAASLDSDIHDKRNEHWMEAYKLCHPCVVKYDWIGQYDSLQTDADRILRSVGVDPTVRFPNFTTNPTGSSNPNTLLRYYSQLASDEITAIYRQYFLDFSMFGFDIPASIHSLVG